MALFLYNVFLVLYNFGVHITALKSKKAKMWISGRKNIFPEIENWRKHLPQNQKLLWIHCASLGEFEQGRPLIEKIKANYTDFKILLTFFSPSGYEVQKNYKAADAVFYLPLDGKANAQRFLNIVKPSLVVWVKYEYWFYYLTALKQRNIPVLLVSAVFRNTQPFFKWYGKLWILMLHSFSRIFVQNNESLLLLQSIGLAQNAEVSGDTRFDRVMEIAEKNVELPVSLTNFVRNHNVIVAGSTWEEDEEELVHYANINTDIKFIIATHEVDEERLAEVKKLFKSSILFSKIKTENVDEQVIIIDNVGMLAQLYQLASVAYIGGGFNSSGIHNILEAAVFGKPIIFGPVYEKFAEAKALVQNGGAFSIANALELEVLLDTLLKDENYLKKTGLIAKKYVSENAGATDKIMGYITQNVFLPTGQIV